MKRLAPLFTDLKGSTALYERVGDMKAFELVRLHFGYLRECISHHSGALVKTIGDAVMASFIDPIVQTRTREGVQMGKLSNTVRVMVKPLAGGEIQEYLSLVPRDQPEVDRARGKRCAAGEAP